MMSAHGYPALEQRTCFTHLRAVPPAQGSLEGGAGLSTGIVVLSGSGESFDSLPGHFWTEVAQRVQGVDSRRAGPARTHKIWPQRRTKDTTGIPILDSYPRRDPSIGSESDGRARFPSELPLELLNDLLKG
jgi:hypothetical protein